jgi:hypothetical protein
VSVSVRSARARCVSDSVHSARARCVSDSFHSKWACDSVCITGMKGAPSGLIIIPTELPEIDVKNTQNTQNT